MVFDFGSEMYVWTGKQAPFHNRKVGLRLARELWSRGYDYSDSEINPMSPLLGMYTIHCIGLIKLRKMGL